MTMFRYGEATLALSGAAFEFDNCGVWAEMGALTSRAAGQTVAHLHIHLIPRYVGDRDDPRGGVRWVLPDKAAYWKED